MSQERVDEDNSEITQTIKEKVINHFACVYAITKSQFS